MLNVVMLSVVMLNVVMLSVVVPARPPPFSFIGPVIDFKGVRRNRLPMKKNIRYSFQTR